VKEFRDNGKSIYSKIPNKISFLNSDSSNFQFSNSAYSSISAVFLIVWHLLF